MPLKLNVIGKVGKQNRMAGKHPSYAKLNLSPEAYRKRLAYDKLRQNTPKRIAYRTELNKKNRQLIKSGKARVGDGKDIAHKVAYSKGGTLKTGYILQRAKLNRAIK